MFLLDSTINSLAVSVEVNQMMQQMHLVSLTDDKREELRPKSVVFNPLSATRASIDNMSSMNLLKSAVFTFADEFDHMSSVQEVPELGLEVRLSRYGTRGVLLFEAVDREKADKVWPSFGWIINCRVTGAKQNGRCVPVYVKRGDEYQIAATPLPSIEPCLPIRRADGRQEVEVDILFTYSLPSPAAADR
jgi:hypothetical protein